MARPTASDSNEAVMNHSMALPNTRPTAPASPIWAIPTTRVENTSGPISILISRRNTSETIESHVPSPTRSGTLNPQPDCDQEPCRPISYAPWR